MALENMTGPNAYISAMVQTNPTATDPEGEGDDHIRGIKNCILNTFPNVTAPVLLTAAQFNALITAPLQVPIGAVLDFAGGALPANYLLVPTAPAVLSRTTYAALFAVLNSASPPLPWGAGDGSTTFGIPYIPIGQPALNNTLPGGTTAGQLLAHTHAVPGAASPTYGPGSNVSRVDSGAGSQTTTTQTPAGGSNNMPAGIYFQKILRVA